MNRVFKALSDPTRRRVLQLLRPGPLSAGDLADHFDVSRPTMSAHFAVLQDAGLVAAERHGRTILYHLQVSVLEDALLSFAQTVGLGAPAPARPRASSRTGAAPRRPLRGTA